MTVDVSSIHVLIEDDIAIGTVEGDVENLKFQFVNYCDGRRGVYLDATIGISLVNQSPHGLVIFFPMAFILQCKSLCGGLKIVKLVFLQIQQYF